MCRAPQQVMKDPVCCINTSSSAFHNNRKMCVGGLCYWLVPKVVSVRQAAAVLRCRVKEGRLLTVEHECKALPSSSDGKQEARDMLVLFSLVTWSDNWNSIHLLLFSGWSTKKHLHWVGQGFFFVVVESRTLECWTSDQNDQSSHICLEYESEYSAEGDGQEEEVVTWTSQHCFTSIFNLNSVLTGKHSILLYGHDFLLDKEQLVCFDSAWRGKKSTF